MHCLLQSIQHIKIIHDLLSELQMRTVGRAYFLHLRINANEFSHECYNNGVDTIFHSHTKSQYAYHVFVLSKISTQIGRYMLLQNKIYTYSYIHKQEKLSKYSNTFSGPHLNLFVSINSFMSIIGIHHLEFKENLFPLLISFKCKARNCYDNQNAPKFKRCLRHTQLILQQES